MSETIKVFSTSIVVESCEVGEQRGYLINIKGDKFFQRSEIKLTEHAFTSSEALLVKICSILADEQIMTEQF